MDFITAIKLIDSAKGNCILIILNNIYMCVNYNDLLKFESFQICGTNTISFDSVYNYHTILHLLQGLGMTRGVDYILWEKKHYYKIVPYYMLNTFHP